MHDPLNTSFNRVAANSHEYQREQDSLFRLISQNIPEGYSIEDVLLVIDEEMELPKGEDGKADRVLIYTEDIVYWKDYLKNLIDKGLFLKWLIEKIPEKTPIWS